jgi:nucleoporin NUP2
MNTSTPALKTPADAPSTSRFAGFGGFGKPPSTSTSTTPVFGFAATLPGPSASFATTAAGSSSELASSGPGDVITTTPTSEDAPTRPITESFALNTDNKHDQEGAGEEDEETVHSVKLKSYVLREEEDKKNWVEMGYGVLRLKKHKDTGARRVLLRSSSTGQILIVSSLFQN